MTIQYKLHKQLKLSHVIENIRGIENTGQGVAIIFFKSSVGKFVQKQYYFQTFIKER